MGFFHSKNEKLPIRGRKKLPLRGKRAKRLKYLRQFDAGRLYTFAEYFTADLPEDLPKDLLTEESDNGQRQHSYN